MLRQDLVFAVRMLRKAPGFTLAAVLATALGIGANTAIFTVVKQVLLQPLPYPAADRLVRVEEFRGGKPTTVSAPNFVDWRAKNRTLDALGAYNEQSMTLSGGFDATRVNGVLADADVLRALRIAPALGRPIDEADTRVGARNVVLLGHHLWTRLFGADRSIVGRAITLEGTQYEVIGVMPPGFDFPEGAELWTPLILTPRDLRDNQRGAHYLGAIGRLRDGVTRQQSEADLDAIEQSIAAQFPTRVGGYSVGLDSMLDSMVGPVQRPLWILFGAVACVLLIACVNVSNLLLARAATRTTEIAVRSALGAGRPRLIRQLLAESVVLSLAGGAAGLLLALWGVRALMALAPSDLPRAAAVQIDVTVLAFCVALSLAAGVLFGVAPAVIASRADLAVFLRDARRDGGTPAGRRRLRAILVTAQVALALVLLAGAGLAVRSFARLTNVSPGFRTAGVLTFQIALPEATYPSLSSMTRFYRDYVDQVRREPGVIAAGAINFAPLTRAAFGGSFTIYGRPEGSNEGNAQIRSITPGYVEALAIPVRAGRSFDERDTETAPRVALVSESAARRYWPGENPIGKQIRVHVNEAVKDPREIVGVVADVHIQRLDVAPVPVVYVPHAQYGAESMTVMVRTAGDPLASVGRMQALLRTIGSGVAMNRVRSLDDVAAASVAEPRFRTLVLSIFGVVSLALAALGLYGVVAFSVSQRRSELGLRMALGADRSRVLSLVVREGMMPVVAGLVVGLAGAVMLARVMKTLLFEIDTFDPVTFGAVSFALFAVALIACYVPARRATLVDPASTLR